jgi:hypothetical protein
MAKERERPLKEGRGHAHPKTFCNREERERVMAKESERVPK